MYYNRLLLSLVLPLVLFFAACTSPETSEPFPVAPSLGSMEKPDFVSDIRIILKTSKGDINAILFATKSPITVANFLNLAQRDYYDGLTFHRVLDDFMIQGGDPEGTGRGGPGYKFEDEFHPALRHYRGGLFSMANSGPDSNGSQFFITHKATPWLDGKHTIFGRVLQGQAVVNKIRKGDTILDVIILDSPAKLFEEQQERVDYWNMVLAAQGK